MSSAQEPLASEEKFPEQDRSLPWPVGELRHMADKFERLAEELEMYRNPPVRREDIT